MYIVIELGGFSLSKELLKNDGCSKVETDGFDGTSFISVLVDLTQILVPSITGIVIASIRAKKHVSIKRNGIEIKGINEKTADKLIRDLLDES